MYLDLEKIKKHLNINDDYTADDMYLTDLSEVAERVVETHIDNKLNNIASKNGGTLPAPILHAMLLFIGNMYANRESVAFVSANEIPLSYAYILDLYKCYYHSNNEDEDEEMIIIIDNLTSDRTDAALSAKQGKVLKELIDNIDAYSKSEVDSKLGSKANVDDVYTKSEVDTKLDDISAGDVDLSSYYNKSEVDGLLANKADSSSLASKLDVSTYNSDKVNFALKSEIPDVSDFVTLTDADEKYQVKGDYLTSIPAEYVTDDELTSKGYATTTQLSTKLDSSTYNTEKQTFATKDELSSKADASDLGNYVTTETANSTYATKSEIGEINNILDSINGEVI